MTQIKMRREAAGLTQAQFAKSLGVSRTAVAMWETAGAHPRTEMLPRIAELLRCTIDDLFDSAAKNQATG